MPAALRRYVSIHDLQNTSTSHCQPTTSRFECFFKLWPVNKKKVQALCAIHVHAAGGTGKMHKTQNVSQHVTPIEPLTLQVRVLRTCGSPSPWITLSWRWKSPSPGAGWPSTHTILLLWWLLDVHTISTMIQFPLGLLFSSYWSNCSAKYKICHIKYSEVHQDIPCT